MKTKTDTPEILLSLALGTIQDPLHFCQGHWATTADGTPCGPASARAIRWCASGMLRHFGASEEIRWPALCHLNNTARKLYKRPIVEVNDILGHEAVIKVYEEAIREV